MARGKATPRDARGAQHFGQRMLALAREAPGLAAMAGMAVVGIGVLVYLTIVHYAKVPLFCPASGLINCAQVTSSAYSVVPGTAVPITIPGIVWFLVSGGLAVVALRSLWRGQAEPARLRMAQLGWSALGLVVVLYLVYVELVRLHAICEWCTVAHVLIFATLLVALARWQRLAALEPVAPAARSKARGAAKRANGDRTRSTTAARSTSPRSTERSSQPVGSDGPRRRANGKARTRG
jgi:uncharacterized membrane protein